MINIKSKFRRFFDLDGSLLDGGFVYVGQPNLNPELLPISIYRDESRQTSAGQPLRTQRGNIFIDGKSSEIYVDSDDFSIAVRNKSGDFVFGSSSIIRSGINLTSDSHHASLVGFVQSGSDAVQRSVQDKLRESVSVVDHGVLEGGSAAENSRCFAKLNPGGQYVVPAGVYKIGSTVFPSITLVFLAGAKLLVDDESSLAGNATEIVSGRSWIFELGQNVRFLGDWHIENLMPEWFGADPFVKFSYDPASSDGKPSGRDSSNAWKNMMGFAQSLVRCSIALAPGGFYYVSGDNPCGLQGGLSKSYEINIEGNKARIYWRPSAVADSLFGRLGMLYRPQWRNFAIRILAKPGDRMGTVFNTKTGVSTLHYFSAAKFSSIHIGSGESIGCDRVFNFESDSVNTHDDLSIFEQIGAYSFNVFCSVRNSEAVKNTFRSCMTAAFTKGAITFNISPEVSFSGYFTIDDHSFSVAAQDEVLLSTSPALVVYPIFIRSSRLEVLNKVGYRMFDLQSCKVVVEGFTGGAGSGSAPGYFVGNKDYIKIGSQASLVLKDSTNIPGNIRIGRGYNGYVQYSFLSERTTFVRELRGERTLSCFPKFLFGSLKDRFKELRLGYRFNDIKIIDPIGHSLACLPYRVSGGGIRDVNAKVFSILLGSGRSSLKGEFPVPENIVFESIFIDVAKVARNSIDSLVVQFSGENGSVAKAYTINLSAEKSASLECLTKNKLLSIPVETVVEFRWLLNGVVVRDEERFPEARCKFVYREAYSYREANEGRIGEVDLI